MDAQTVKENARIALDARLHVRGWGLQIMLQYACKNPEQYQVHLHYEDGKPVGVMLIVHSSSEGKPRNNIEVQMYVRKAYRRRGIASRLLAGFVDPHPKGKVRPMRASRGRPGSVEFWKRHNVRPWYCPPNMKKENWDYS